MRTAGRRRPPTWSRSTVNAALMAGGLVLALTACAASTSTGSSSPPVPSSGSTTSDPAVTTPTAPGASPSASTTSGGTAVKPVPVEVNPPGDIPDNVAYVPYSNAAGGYGFTHPEGWAQTGAGSAVRFTDKLNGVAADVVTGAAPTVSSATATDVARLRTSVPAFELKGVSAARLPAGPGVRIVFRRNSAPDDVTGRVYRDEVEEYLIPHGGKVLRLDLYGPVGADNVDAYKTVVTSVMWR